MRVLLRFLFSAVGILAASAMVPGIHAGTFTHLLAVAVILGFLNATVGQLIKVVAFVPVACSFGCLNLFINGLVFLLASRVAVRLGLDFHISGFWPAFFCALVSGILAWLLELVLIGKPRPQGPPPPPRAPRTEKHVN